MFGQKLSSRRSAIEKGSGHGLGQLSIVIQDLGHCEVTDALPQEEIGQLHLKGNQKRRVIKSEEVMAGEELNLSGH